MQTKEMMSKEKNTNANKRKKECTCSVSGVESGAMYRA